MRAHPRSRGENAHAPTSAHPHSGSSPLTRGKLRHGTEPAGQLRLIPAHAGKTARERRGDALVSGSSPLTRGKQRKRRHSLRRSGLIPAHAGKTRGDSSREARARAHPRSRGENINTVWNIVSTVGSSPLTRGKPPLKGDTSTIAGLIPAHAGKTRPFRMLFQGDRAHPRSRGENLPLLLSLLPG